MEKTRENNYDMLRIICTIAVIMIHVSATYVSAYFKTETFGVYYTKGIEITNIYNVISRFAVPCFVMLSGAFILDDNKNADYIYFYKKAFRNIGIPVFIFSFLYFLYQVALAIASVIIKGQDKSRLLLPVTAWIKGAPFYHMWYMYMLMGVMLLVPLVLRFKNDIGEKKFSRISWVFLILAVCSVWTSKHTLYWDIGLTFCYLGYFMIGYVIRRKFIDIRNTILGLFLILGGIGFEGIAAVLNLSKTIAKIEGADQKIIGPYCPLIVIASLLIFTGFSLVTININISKLSSITFLIYLFHAGIWDLFSKIMTKSFGVSLDNRIVIPVAIMLVFISSIILSKLYIIVWSIVDRKIKISARTSDLVGITLKRYFL